MLTSRLLQLGRNVTTGMHYSILAVRADVAQLVAAVPLAWANREPAQTATVAGFGELHDWSRANQRVVTSAPGAPTGPGIDVFGFWQDGAWAVTMDASHVMLADAEALQAVSERFGRALCFSMETTSGCAFFDAYEGGRRVRSLRACDGDLTSEGERLPEEAHLPRKRFYMREMDRLQEAFGLSPPGDLPDDQAVLAAAFIDHTDYAALRREHETLMAESKRANRPWWRFW